MNLKTIMENWRKFNKASKALNEDASPKKFPQDQFPTRLSQVDPATAVRQTTSGKKDGSADDDVINVQKAEFDAGQLKPSQTSMKLSNALGMALSMIHPEKDLKAGGDLGGFISSDLHIMDGHHRWVATAMIDPKLKCGGNYVSFPAQQLIPILNAITVGRLKVPPTGGKEGSGGFDQFKNPALMKKILVELTTKGNPPHITAEEANQAVAIFCKNNSVEPSVDNAVEKFMGNLSGLTFKTPKGAPDRIDMPVIDTGDVAAVTNVLQGGEVDVNKPFAKADQASSDEE